MRPALFFCLVCLFACGKSEEPAAATAPAPAAPAPAAPTPVPAAPAEPIPSAEELPVAEDFTGEAEQQIDAKSYKAELAKLDKEMSAEAK